jgi:hypothetical protein
MVLLTVSSAAWPDELTGIGTAGLALVTFITLLVTITLAARQRTHELRQLQDAEAHALQATLGHNISPERDTFSLIAVIVNHSAYPVTNLKVFFVADKGGKGVVSESSTIVTKPAFENPADLTSGYTPTSNGPDAEQSSTLARWDVCARFVSPAFQVNETMQNPFAVVRWTDRWGQQWSNRAGIVERHGAVPRGWPIFRARPR